MGKRRLIFLVILLLVAFCSSNLSEDKRKKGILQGALYTPPVFPMPPQAPTSSYFQRFKEFWKGVWKSMCEISLSFTAGMYAGEDWQRQNFLSNTDDQTKKLIGSCDSEFGVEVKRISKRLYALTEEANVAMAKGQQRRYVRLYRKAEKEKRLFQRKVIDRLRQLPLEERYIQLQELFNLLYEPDVLYNPIADKNSKALVWAELQKVKKELQLTKIANARIVDGQGETT